MTEKRKGWLRWALNAGIRDIIMGVEEGKELKEAIEMEKFIELYVEENLR